MFYGVGRCVNDPEMRETQTGTQICSVNIAFPRRIKRDGQPEADFFKAYAFGKTGEILAKYFTKGKPIDIQSADIQNRSWEDQSGNKRYATELFIQQLGFVPTDTGTGNGAAQQSVTQAAKSPSVQAAKKAPTPTGDNEDELPF